LFMIRLHFDLRRAEVRAVDSGLQRGDSSWWSCAERSWRSTAEVA